MYGQCYSVLGALSHDGFCGVFFFLQLTARAKLGAKAYGYLKKGKATPEQLLVDIMVEAIR